MDAKEHLPKSAVIRGRRYRLVWRKPRRSKAGNHDGFCDHPMADSPAIQVNPNQDPLLVLDTTIHETLHACFPDADERAIAESMNSIMRLLIRMGIQVGFAPGTPCPHKWYPASLE